jgi:predicted Zn finger-like uncharacterized protein
VLTQCPNCETTFRVTSEILRVAQGQVRCGRCQTQFDALQRLIEERTTASDEPVRQFRTNALPTSVAEETAAIEVEEPDTREEITMEGKRIEISGTYRVVDDASGDGEPQLRQETVEEWMEVEEDVDASDSDQIPQGYVDVSAEVDDAAEFDELADSRERLVRDVSTSDVDDDGTAVRAQRRSRAHTDGALDPVDDLSVLDIGSQRRRPRALIWKILAVPLVLLLGAQIVHHNRAELARNPRLGAPLMKIYRALNLQLTPAWDLQAYEIKQWGVMTDAAAPGTLKVRASITNRATFPQPYPLLKLILEDRWGDQVRAREFEPAEYLDHDVAAQRLFAPDQPTNATIVIVDPGPDAEGFRFDVCLRGDKGLVCAADVPK